MFFLHFWQEKIRFEHEPKKSGVGIRRNPSENQFLRRKTNSYVGTRRIFFQVFFASNCFFSILLLQNPNFMQCYSNSYNSVDTAYWVLYPTFEIGLVCREILRLLCRCFLTIFGFASIGKIEGVRRYDPALLSLLALVSCAFLLWWFNEVVVFYNDHTGRFNFSGSCSKKRLLDCGSNIRKV